MNYFLAKRSQDIMQSRQICFCFIVGHDGFEITLTCHEQVIQSNRVEVDNLMSIMSINYKTIHHT